MGLYILAMLVGAILCALLAHSRGRSRLGWAIAGAAFPLISLLVLAVMGPATETAPAVSTATSHVPVKSAPPERRRDESEQEYAERLARLGYTSQA